ncbi:MAG: protein-glutamate methylesterase/protein-glutamine glutaminase [Rhodospirillaceae bacterium]
MATTEPFGSRTGDHDPIRVMVVDDSAVVRGLETRMLEADPAIKVVASVGNGQMALSALDRNDIEVVILDIEMPVMDGLTALPKILAKDPSVKVIMASTLTLKNAEVSLQALNLGASDYLTKPSSSRELTSGGDFTRELPEKVKALGQAARRTRSRTGPRSAASPKPGGRVPFSRPGTSAASPASAPGDSTLSRTAALRGGAAKPAPSSHPSPAPTARAAAGSHGSSAGHATSGFALAKPSRDKPAIIAIGSSTGGPQALFKVLGDMKAAGWVKQPVIITQHMPATFTTILAGHIGRITGGVSKEGEDGEVLVGGNVYVAPGDHHMVVETKGTETRLRINQDPPENFCRPAVDPMFRSVSSSFGRRSLAVVLTGMGSDGAKGGKIIADGGGTLIAQDEPTSVVWGMPGAAAHTGACSAVLPLEDIGSYILRLANKT